MKTAYIIVDVQNDFVEGGALGVDGGKHAAVAIADYLTASVDDYDLIVTTQDWHIEPGDHFLKWPVHCVNNTTGAALYSPVADLICSFPPEHVVTIHKGQWDDGYSGFDGVDENEESLLEVLHRNNIEVVVIGGIATDYCVRATALDALHYDFDTVVAVDNIAGVAAESSQKALDEIKEAGGLLMTMSERGIK